MPTIRDVAKRAGVATSTVSRVLNNSGYVSAATRARVEAAIDELGYVPNRVARSLRLKRTNTLAMLVADISNPFWTTVVRGAEDAANEAGFTVVLCNTDESKAKQDAYLDVLLQRRVDGILFAPVCSVPEPVERVQRQKVPIVVLDRRVPGAQVDVVRGDSEGGAYKLVRYLLELGHARIAALSGPKSVSTSVERIEGYRRALREAGLGEDADRVYFGTFTEDAGYDLTFEALEADPRPTALFACNNFMAAGVLRALRQAGLRLPQDVSLVAFDDLPSWMLIEPFLTVADQPAYEMGRQAAELLIARLAVPASGPTAGEVQEIVLPTEIVVRRSCRRVSTPVEQVAQAV
jgi:LacI family transcriptional regulator